MRAHGLRSFSGRRPGEFSETEAQIGFWEHGPIELVIFSWRLGHPRADTATFSAP